jgi:hypothetical protein
LEAPTKRHEMFPAYQSGRKFDDDLIEQLNVLLQRVSRSSKLGRPMELRSTCLSAFRISMPVDPWRKLSSPKDIESLALSGAGLISNLEGSHRRSPLQACGRQPLSKLLRRRRRVMALSASTNCGNKRPKPKSFF